MPGRADILDTHSSRVVTRTYWAGGLTARLLLAVLRDCFSVSTSCTIQLAPTCMHTCTRSCPSCKCCMHALATRTLHPVMHKLQAHALTTRTLHPVSTSCKSSVCTYYFTDLRVNIHVPCMHLPIPIPIPGEETPINSFGLVGSVLNLPVGLLARWLRLFSVRVLAFKRCFKFFVTTVGVPQ